MYLLDTDFCIDWLRRKDYARNALAAVKPSAVAVSAVTVGELLMGACGSQSPDRETAKVRQFLQPIRVIDFGSVEAGHFGSLAAMLRGRGQLIGVADTMIAATAVAHALVVVTRNRRHFEKVETLKISDWAATFPD